MQANRDALLAQGARVLVVGFEERTRTQAWLRQRGITLPFLLDPDRRVYRAYALERSWWRAWHPRNLWFYTRHVLRGGALPRIKADPNQMGGDFLIDRQGVIQLAYYGQNATDRPALKQIFAALEALNDS